MQHKLLSILTTLLILLGANQCKCNRQPVYDTINVDLQWEEPQPMDLAGLNLKTNKGFSCRVPSESATYFINAADGKTYKFTQEGSTLGCQLIGNVAPFNIGKAFVFAAGSMQKQHLYFGTVSGNQIIINQLEEGIWKQVITQGLSTLGSTIQEDKFIIACTLEIDGQQKGVLCSFKKKRKKSELGCLLFDSATKILTKVSVGPSYSQGVTNSTYLIGALGIRPGKILLGKGHYNTQHKDSYDILHIEVNTLRLLSKDFKNNLATIPVKGGISKGGKARWELFSLTNSEVNPTILVPLFTLSNNNIYSFFRLNSKSDFQQLTITPSYLSSNPSLVIPLGDKLCLITTRLKPVTDGQQNSGQQEECIYYQAQLNEVKEENNKQSNQN